METLIGKKYVSFDNSYTLNLTNQNRDYRLAGMHGENPKEATIVSEPYKQIIDSIVDGKKEYDFINVEYEGDTIRVLFYEKAVDADLQERIEKNKNRLMYHFYKF